VRGDSGSVDAAIARYLQRQDDASAAALAATGPAGAQRVVGIWYGTERPLEDNPIAGAAGRDALDRWAATLAVVARAAPETFMDLIAGKKTDTLLLAILGYVDDPRATAILCRHASDPDSLLRYNAVRALGRSNDPAARPCVERALGDDDLVVRNAAIEAISSRDPARAIELYQELLDAEGLTPVLRREVRSAIRELRAGEAGIAP
jgi:HEAT repeat protein